MRATRWAIPVVALILSSGSQGAAQGYIDPGAGSYLLQLGVAIAFGALYALKTYWKETRSLVARRFARERGNGSQLGAPAGDERRMRSSAGDGSGPRPSGRA